MLCTDRNFQWFRIKIDSVFGINIDSKRIHVRKPFNRQWLHSFSVLKISKGLFFKIVYLKNFHRIGADRIFQKVHVNTTAFLCFVEYEHVNKRGLVVGDSLRIKRPLVAFKKYICSHPAH